jgi:uncharacterized protein YukE
MIISQGQLQQAAAEIRGAEASLAGIVAELRDAGVWSGDDAERFQRDWNDQVRGRLLGAAALLDGVTVTTLS